MLLYGTAYWASIKTPNTKFKPQWTINIVPEDPQDLEELKSKGFKTKLVGPDQLESIVIRRYVDGKNGPNSMPKLRDAHNQPIDVQVGNGSRVCVQYKEFSGKNSYGAYQGLDLQAVQVLDLVEFAGEDGSEFKDFDPESEL